MDKIFKKQNILPIAVLGAICIVVAALLAFVNSFTSKEIERQRIEAANAGNIEVLPNLDVMSKEVIEVDSEKYPKEVKTISKFDIGYVIETEVKGNASGMVVLVGIDNSGKVTGVKIISNGETPSYWATVEPEVTGENGAYNGDTVDTLQQYLVSGATNSSKGVYNAVKIALDAFELAYDPGDADLPRSEDEIKTIVANRFGTSEELVKVKFDEHPAVKRIYKDSEGSGYAAYIAVTDPYDGIVETETIIFMDNDVRIIGYEKILWDISDAENGYAPPTETIVNDFYKNLIGHNLEEFNKAFIADNGGKVDLIASATNTSRRLVESIAAALSEVAEISKPIDIETPDVTPDEPSSSVARIIGVAVFSAIVLAIAACIAVPKIIRRRKAG